MCMGADLALLQMGAVGANLRPSTPTHVRTHTYYIVADG